MATLPEASESRGASPTGRLVEYEEFIESQLRKTRSHVRGVDLAARLLTLVAGMLGYLLLAAVVDHWVVPGGLGFGGRLLFLAGGLGLGGYLAGRMLPLLIKRINPLYAAQTIERSRPALKNGLLNFLFFRQNPAGLSPVVYQAIEEQAATSLAQGHEEVAVDRTQLIRVGYVLVGILLVCAAYALFSPKDLFRTAGRVIMPWADIEPPTRTLISHIEPGSVQVFRGERVTVKAHIENLKAGETVTLFYSTADAQTMDRAVAMRLPPDGYQYECVVPAGEESLQQSLVYRIEAGDAVSAEYRMDVADAPTILVRSVEYKYPAYTGLRPQRVENQGDLKGLEGTEITLRAAANERIESAYIDFQCDDQLDRRMTAEENQAQATFFLSLRDDRQTPTYENYRLVFKNAQGQRNPQPVRHEIEVTRDQAPEIQFLSPQPADIELPLDGAVELEVVANDPDFALRSIDLLATVGGQPLIDKRLLDEVWRGQAVKKLRVAAGKLGLKAGDVVEYRAVAEDNKEPQPNRTETAARRIRIVAPAGPAGDGSAAKRDRAADSAAPEPGDDASGGGRNDHPRDADAPPQDSQADEPAPGAMDRDAATTPAGEERPAEPQPGAPGDEPAGDDRQAALRQNDAAQGGKQADDERSDSPAAADRQADAGGQAAAPNDGSNDGEAFDRILKKLKERDSGQSGDSDERLPPKPADSKPPKSNTEQPPDGEPNADQQSPPQQGAGKKGSEQPGGGEKGAGEKGGGEKGGGEKGAGEKGAGEKGGGEKGRGDDTGSQGQQGQEGTKAGKQGAKAGDEGPDAGSEDPQTGDNSTTPDSHSDGRGKGKPSRSQADSSAEPADERGDGERGEPSGDAADGQAGDPSKGPKPPGQNQDSRGKSAAGGERPNDAGDGDKAPGGDKPQADDTRKSLTPDDQATHDGQGQGGKSQDDPLAKPDKQAPRDEQGADSAGGDGERNKGTSGAGQRGQPSQGSPSPDQPNQPRQKRPGASKEDPNERPNDPAASPSNSQRESDSQGQDAGDRSGGGQQGGGQKANKSGTGGAGQNTAADEGAGKSAESGQGEDSDRAGTDRPSGRSTGQQGDQRGTGSTTRPASESGDGQPADASSAEGRPGGPSAEPSGQQPGAPGGAAVGESPSQGQSNPSSSPQAWKAGQEQADKANLEYARQATDLALRHLKEELAKEKPDGELLKELGWSREELQKFLDRWEQMQAKAGTRGQSGKAAQRDLDDTLRSLGLRPRATAFEGNRARGKKSQGEKETRRATPPPEFAEEYKAYTEGTARGGK